MLLVRLGTGLVGRVSRTLNLLHKDGTLTRRGGSDRVRLALDSTNRSGSTNTEPGAVATGFNLPYIQQTSVKATNYGTATGYVARLTMQEF